MAKKSKEGFVVGGIEKTSYALYFFGLNMFYGLVALNVQTLFSDFGLTASVIALILLITKVWDAINDPLFGVILDKVRFKKGRFLPWIRIALPATAISSLFLFALPTNGPVWLKIVWGTIGYIAWDMSYTICDVPCFLLQTSMTDNIKERSNILAIGRYFALVGVMVISLSLPMVQARVGWLWTGIIYAVAGAVLMIPITITGKERHIVRSEKNITIGEMFSFVRNNKFLLIFYGGYFLSQVTLFSSAVGIFFARYNLGNQDMASVLGLASMIPSLLIGAIVPGLIKRVDKFKLYFGAGIATVLLSVIRYFVGYSSIGLFAILLGVQGLASGISSVLVFMFTPDCLEYGTYHTGKRADGVAASIQTFFAKLVGSFSGPLAMLVIGAFGFVAGENAVQPQSAIQGIWLCLTLFPSIGVVAALILWSRYKLREEDVQVMAKYNTGKITKVEAEEKLADKYGPAADISDMLASENQ